MIAQDFMTKNVISCKQTQTVEEAAALMSDKGFGVMGSTRYAVENQFKINLNA